MVVSHGHMMEACLKVPWLVGDGGLSARLEVEWGLG